MKTLSEVIKSLEDARVQVKTGNGYWIDYQDNDDLKNDVLQYLKEYKGRISDLDSAENVIKRIGKNEPLTWSELRKMEGKPVWVVADEKERWRIITEVSSELLMLESGLPLHRSWMNHPDGWQAYKKEQK